MNSSMSLEQDASVIDQALTEILAALAGKDDPHQRALRSKARTFALSFRAWASVPPSDAQRAALLELVVELWEKVAGGDSGV
jgi:hypothetical protein